MASKSSNRDTFNKLLKSWADYYKQTTVKLIALLRENNISDKEIAQKLGITEMGVKYRYPKGDKQK